MSRSPKTVPVAVASLVLVLILGGVVAWRHAARGGVTPEGYAILTPVPGATGFEPQKRPAAPVLRAGGSNPVTVDFGYEVGETPYGYALSLAFAPGATEGKAVVSVRRDGHTASTESAVVRRWDAPRAAYAVAVSDRFMTTPAVPALCIKAVIGPGLDAIDLSDGTICVAQRGADGTCHPETLACGLLRPR